MPPRSSVAQPLPGSHEVLATHSLDKTPLLARPYRLSEMLALEKCRVIVERGSGAYLSVLSGKRHQGRTARRAGEPLYRTALGGRCQSFSIAGLGHGRLIGCPTHNSFHCTAFSPSPSGVGQWCGGIRAQDFAYGYARDPQHPRNLALAHLLRIQFQYRGALRLAQHRVSSPVGFLRRYDGVAFECARSDAARLSIAGDPTRWQPRLPAAIVV